MNSVVQHFEDVDEALSLMPGVTLSYMYYLMAHTEIFIVSHC